jgi:arginase
MTSQDRISLVGVESGIGANNTGCGDGPIFLRDSKRFSDLIVECPQIHWHEIVTAEPGLSKLDTIVHVDEHLAYVTSTLSQNHERFIVIGGDHSAAIGTWSGVQSVYQNQGPIGLLWIDAHLDSHTFKTTISGNIHGMPLAALMGRGAETLTHLFTPQTKLLPKHVCIFGVRSFEQGELETINNLGVRVFYMDEINQRGLEDCYEEAMGIVKLGTVGYGISFDLDAIDPIDAPGVGSPVPDGIRRNDLLPLLQGEIYQPNLLGFEIMEFNPHLDKDRLTESLIIDTIRALITVGKT